MPAQPDRRDFLKTAGAAYASLAGLDRLREVMARSPQDSRVTANYVRFGPDIEPVIRLIEATPRAKCVEVMVDQLRGGLPYRQFVAALFLAGIRNFKPASTGAMHAVFVIHSAHDLGLDAAPEERLLPMLFALDLFKSHTENVEEGRRIPSEDRLQPVSEKTPSADEAPLEFRAAMDAWDGERAERAMVALLRSRSAATIAEALWPYAARSVEHIGHKAIFAANAWRTLEVIGWQHAELVLRAVTLALTSHRMKYAAGERARFSAQPYAANVERVRIAKALLPADWSEAQSDLGLTRELLAALHDGHGEDACHLAATQLAAGRFHAGSVWDAVHLGAAELLMRQSGIDAVHSVTSSNALHYLFRMGGRTETRLLILLQAVGWIAEFHRIMGNHALPDVRITELTPGELPATEEAAVRAVLGAEVLRSPRGGADSRTAGDAAMKAFRYCVDHPEADAFRRAARRLVCLKGDEEHDFKFAAASFEDFRFVDPRWRPHVLASSLHALVRSDAPDAPVTKRALGAVSGK